jgi:hypothetical protein
LSSQRLEGSDLEALLARVREEHGGAARIVEANKLRRGGLGGFFAKESFEVVVDVDGDDGPVEGAVDEIGRADHAAGADRFDRFEADHDDQDDQDDEEPFVPFTIDELASSVDDPAPSFAARARAKERFADAGAVGPDEEVLADDAPTFSEVLGRAIAAERATALEPAWPATAAVRAAAPAARIVAPRFEPGGLTGVGGLSGVDLAALARLGLPLDQAALVARSDDPAAVAMVRLLERFPTAPALPRAARAVIAVVGDREEAIDLAASIAGDRADVLVAADRRGADLRTAASVVDLRASWRRRRRPVVVAVASPFAVAASPWAAGVLDALEPAMVLGHVDAGRKPEDVAAWSTSVGGIDALAVTGLERTTTPAAILGAGIPVATLDGAPATPARWAALLTDRITAALAA